MDNNWSEHCFYLRILKCAWLKHNLCLYDIVGLRRMDPYQQHYYPEGNGHTPLRPSHRENGQSHVTLSVVQAHVPVDPAPQTSRRLPSSSDGASGSPHELLRMSSISTDEGDDVMVPEDLRYRGSGSSQSGTQHASSNPQLRGSSILPPGLVSIIIISIYNNSQLCVHTILNFSNIFLQSPYLSYPKIKFLNNKKCPRSPFYVSLNYPPCITICCSCFLSNMPRSDDPHFIFPKKFPSISFLIFLQFLHNFYQISLAPYFRFELP